MVFDKTIIKIQDVVRKQGYITGIKLFDIIALMAPKKLGNEQLLEILRSITDAQDIHTVRYVKGTQADEIYYCHPEVKK